MEGCSLPVHERPSDSSELVGVDAGDCVINEVLQMVGVAILLRGAKRNHRFRNEEATFRLLRGHCLIHEHFAFMPSRMTRRALRSCAISARTGPRAMTSPAALRASRSSLFHCRSRLED